jgi:hypothetical protein
MRGAYKVLLAMCNENTSNNRDVNCPIICYVNANNITCKLYLLTYCMVQDII